MAASNSLSPVATDLKKLLRKGGQTPAQLAERLGRKSAKGLGPALAALVRLEHAIKDEAGKYSKAPKPTA